MVWFWGGVCLGVGAAVGGVVYVLEVRFNVGATLRRTLDVGGM